MLLFQDGFTPSLLFIIAMCACGLNFRYPLSVFTMPQVLSTACNKKLLNFHSYCYLPSWRKLLVFVSRFLQPAVPEANKHPGTLLLTTHQYGKMMTVCAGKCETCYSSLLSDRLKKPLYSLARGYESLCFFFNIWKSKVAWQHKIKGWNVFFRSALKL